MWKPRIYSLGDLSHDEYLQMFDGEENAVVLPKYRDYEDISERMEELSIIISRCNAEIHVLQNYADQIVGATKWKFEGSPF